MSTEKKLGIIVTGSIDDIMSKLDEVIGKVDNISDKSVSFDVNVNESGLETLSADANATAEEVSSIGDASAEASNELTANMSGASNSIVDVGRSATEGKEEINKMGDSADETSALIVGGMALAAGAIFEVAGEAESAAQSINDMSMSYWKLGSGWEGGETALRDQVATITDQRFPEDEATAYISLLKRLGVEQTDLISSSVKLNKIRTSTGSSVEDMTPLLQAYKTMNIDLSNLETTYNAAYYANAKFVGGLPAYTTELRRYASQFAELGLNADQAAVILVAAQNKWPDPRKRRSELNKAITDANGDLSSLEQKLGLTAGSINNAGNITGQYSGKVEDASKKSRELSTDTEKLGAWIDDLKTRFGGALGPIFSFVGLLGYAGAGIAGLWAVLKAGMKLGDWKFDPAGEWIEKPIQRGINKFREFTGTIKDWVKGTDDATRAATNMGSKVSESASVVEKAGYNVGESAGKGISRGMRQSATLIDEAGNVLWTDTDDAIKVIGRKLIPTSESIGFEAGSGIGKGILRSSSRVVGDVAGFSTILIDALANQLEFLNDPTGFIFGPMADIFSLPKPFREILSPTKILRQVVGENAYGMWEQAVKTYIENPMRRAIGDTWNDVTGWFNGLTGGMFKGTETQAIETGAVVQGVLNTTASIGVEASNLMKAQGVSSFKAQAQAAEEYAEKVKAAYDEAKAAAADAMSFFQSSLSSMGLSLPGTKGSSFQTLQDLYDARRTARKELKNLEKMHDEGIISDREYSSQKRKIQETLDQLNDPALFRSIAQSGQSIGQTWGAGISTGITSSTDELNAAIAQASQGLIAHSPPKEGPLRTVDLYGESIGATFTEGIVQGLKATKNRIMSQLENIGLSNLSQTPLPSSTSLGSGGIGGIIIQFTGPITIPEGSDPYEVGSELSRGAADGLVGRLLGQASNAGVPVMNQRR